MKITIIAVGRIKEKYLNNAISEYTKRLTKYTKLEIIEVKDESAAENLSRQEANNIKAIEGKRILSKILPNGFVIALAIDGASIPSEEFSAFIEAKRINGTSHFYFIIGGSLGLSDDVLKTADYKLSFSKMTFPHQLMRVILLEQVYRGFKILKKEPYHK